MNTLFAACNNTTPLRAHAYKIVLWCCSETCEEILPRTQLNQLVRGSSCYRATATVWRGSLRCRCQGIAVVLTTKVNRHMTHAW